eukprot:scaffold17854_cov124-Isochrysis_galbana.AAC.1
MIPAGACTGVGVGVGTPSTYGLRLRRASGRKKRDRGVCLRLCVHSSAARIRARADREPWGIDDLEENRARSSAPCATCVRPCRAGGLHPRTAARRTSSPPSPPTP